MKHSYAQKLYYKSIGKLLVFPVLAILCGILLLIFSARELINLVSLVVSDPHDPHRHWEWGTNERTSGMFRRYFPKGAMTLRWSYGN